MARPQLFTGARGELNINGNVVAFITDVSVNITANVRAVHTFGAANARSVEPLSTGANVSIGRVFPLNRPDGSAVNTSDIAMGIEPIISLLLSSEDITVNLVDKVTGQSVASVRNCRFGGRNLTTGSQNIAGERIQLIGIYDAAGGNTPDAIGL